MMVNCPVCGKLTAIYWPEFWVYRRKDTFYCSENCMIVDEVRDLKLMNQVARERRLRKEATKMANHKLTLEQKKKAVEIAAQGGNPTEYLKKCGAKNPYAAWDYIKKTLAMKDPVLAEKVDKVPTPVGGSEWAKLPDVIGKVEQVEEKNGGIEVTVNATPSAAEAMQNMQDAADTFFRQCGEMGLKLDGAEKIVPLDKIDKIESPKPLVYDGYTVLCVEGAMGRFYYQKALDQLDWTTPDGEEVSFSPAAWKMFATEELPKIMAILGVSL